MPLARRVYRFPELARPTFHGLPGLLADSLPDKFGNVLIEAPAAPGSRSDLGCSCCAGVKNAA